MFKQRADITIIDIYAYVGERVGAMLDYGFLSFTYEKSTRALNVK